MGMLDGIFGGGEDTTTTSPWEVQQPYLERGFSDAERLYDRGSPQYYAGQTIAGTNPAMQAYMNQMQGYGQGGADYGQNMMQQGQQLAGGLDQAQGYFNDAIANYSNPYASAEYGQIMSDSVNNNPLLNQQIEQAQSGINRNLNENIMPSIGSASIGTGNTGSTRRGVAEGIAMRGAMEQGSNAATNLQANAMNQGMNQANLWASGEQQGQQQQFNAANMLSNLGQYGAGQGQQGYGMGANAYQDMLQGGMFERGLDQEQINEDRSKWEFQQDAPWQNIERYQRAIGGNYGGVSTQPSGGSSTGDKLLQTGTTLGAALLMSDRRLKKNIKKVGEIDGLNIYEWSWNKAGKLLAGKQKTRGFIFDEVPEFMKVINLSGFGMVNYTGYENVVGA